MCYPYDEDDEGNQYMRLSVKDKKILRQSPVGTKVKFQVAGEVTEVEAPKMVRDYDIDWDRKKGKRPMKERPGSVKLKLDKGDPDIAIIDQMLTDEEAD